VGATEGPREPGGAVGLRDEERETGKILGMRLWEGHRSFCRCRYSSCWSRHSRLAFFILH
jgi:hypothetical protein